MNTNTKLFIAKGIYRSIRLIRSVIGLDSHAVVCKRFGIHWKLDLSEGIDLSIFLFGRFESSTSKVISELITQGSTVIDIGANIGAHALPMAKRVGKTGKVHAIEPTDWAFEKMTQNLSLNPDLDGILITHKAFLGDGRATTAPSQTHSSWKLDAELKHGIHGGVLQDSANARCFTLDEWAITNGIERIDLIKLDVDGYEAKVLKGALETIRRFRPKILIELTLYNLEEYGNSLGELIGILKDSGYSLSTEDGKREIPMSMDQLEQIIPKKGSINALAIPN